MVQHVVAYDVARKKLHNIIQNKEVLNIDFNRNRYCSTISVPQTKHSKWRLFTKASPEYPK
jgi:hypothetical protein